MARRWMAVHGMLLFFAGCRERNPEFMPDAGSSSDASASVSESASSGVMSTTSAASSESTSTPDTSSVSNGADAESSSSPGEDSTSAPGSESGDPRAPYPACDPDGEPCPRGYTECVVQSDPPISWCSHWCVHTDDCEPPLTGDAPAICWGHDCMLDCTDGQACPDGMVCGTVSDNARCGWPT